MAEYVYEHDGEFEQADVDFNWTAGEVSFECPCGRREIILAEGGDMKRCDCGKVYRLCHYVEVSNE